MRKLQGNMRDHLFQIFEKINNGEHFGVIRPNDGEYRVLKNETLTNIDDWTFTENGVLRQHLIDALKNSKNINNLFIGLPCNSCNEGEKRMYEDYVKTYDLNEEMTTYASIFVNSNWEIFINFMHNYVKGFYFITCGTKPCDFPIKERYIIHEFLVNEWDQKWEETTKNIIEYIKDKKNELICFSAGPLTKYLIPKCMEVNSENVYLDVGSALDFFTKNTEKHRCYTKRWCDYAKQTCNFI